ncbi:MAG: hypothetical protein JWN38_1101 [Candidatus Saccharibacteria bacterium]|nr:hypothetical protein [Candidatus Saccharibacteria bacterium]
MPRYGIATIFEDHPVGHEFAADDLPLHLTHIDSFEVVLQPAELVARLGTLLAGQKAFSVPALADEQYGPEKDIPVTVLELTPELADLHKTLVTFLSEAGAILKNPHFNGDYFSPHVSVYGAKRVNPGEPVHIKDISIAAKVSDAEDASRRILANIPFASASS